MAGKTAVKVESLRENLRLRWSYQRKRYCLSLGLYDSPAARKVAESKAAAIEADLITGNFDPSLEKYRSESIPQLLEDNGLKITALFGRFSEARHRHLTGHTPEKYQTMARKLAGFFGEANAASVDEAKAWQFRESLSHLKPVTQAQQLKLVSACWQWGIDQGMVTANPWVDVARVKVPPQQSPRPFTADEVAAIIQGFEQSPYYAYYTDFARFLFGTGCRTGEAIGLCWGHLSDDCSKAWIGESVSRGIRKATKTNRAREFGLPSNLTAMLQARKPPAAKPTDLVFPAMKGGPIDCHNFRNRAWRAVLEQAGVIYRKPYSTRHTFISHALDNGGIPMLIAQMTGHDPEMLFKHYAAYIKGGLECPALFA